MSVTTPAVDSVLIYIGVFAVLLFFIIVFLMVYFLVRYRRSRNPRATELPGRTWLELLWIGLATLVVISMFFAGLTGFRFLRRIPADSMTVKVVSRMWSWLFVYENGLKSPDLVVPLGRNVKVDLTSEDVIHSFFVPAFRVKQDTVPGMTTHAWFRATQPGTYDILCAEYCGERHSAMLARLIVLPPQQFAAWYAGKPVEAAGLGAPSTRPAGKELLRQKGCLACHSTDGSRLAGPTFQGLYGRIEEVATGDDRHTVTVDDAYLRSAIVNPGADLVVGFRNIMPPGKPALSDEEIEQIVTYLHQLQ